MCPIVVAFSRPVRERNPMHEPSGSSLGTALGAIAVLVGMLYLVLGLFQVLRGNSLDGVDGLVYGGLAFVAGCVILVGRGRVRSKQGESGHAAPSAPADQPRETR